MHILIITEMSQPTRTADRAPENWVLDSRMHNDLNQPLDSTPNHPFPLFTPLIMSPNFMSSKTDTRQHEHHTKIPKPKSLGLEDVLQEWDID